MTTPDPPAGPPAGLTCPLCDYDLRGLTDPRCPECGFAFTWAELADEHRNAHRYLFEHARRRLPAAFWRTFWRTCRPRLFWREVSPANPVHAGRVLAYWAVSNSLLAVAVAALLATSWVDQAGQTKAFRAQWVAVPGRPGTFAESSGDTATAAQLDAWFPPVGSAGFVARVFRPRLSGERLSEALVGTVFLAWPWLSLATLLLFQASMRRANVHHGHVLRAAVYGCDFAVLMASAVAVMWLAEAADVLDVHRWLYAAPTRAAAWTMLAVLTCAGVASYRIGFAYARYLRFDRPLATVLASQVIVVLVVGVILVATGQLF